MYLHQNETNRVSKTFFHGHLPNKSRYRSSFSRAHRTPSVWRRNCTTRGSAVPNKSIESSTEVQSQTMNCTKQWRNCSQFPCRGDHLNGPDELTTEPQMSPAKPCLCIRSRRFDLVKSRRCFNCAPILSYVTVTILVNSHFPHYKCLRSSISFKCTQGN